MSQVIKFVKVVSALPGTLDNNTIYFVKSGFEVLAYVTNDLGMVVAYPLTVDLSSKADVVHEHAGEDITSGVVSADFLPDATTSAQGIVQLSTSVSSTSDTLASTPSAVKQAYDLANAAIPATEKGAANGVAPLGSDSKISSTYLPSYVDDVLEYANLAAFPGTGESGKIYVAIDTGLTYRWSGSAYVLINSGAVISVNGETGAVVLDKTDIGLSNVDNTSDLNKPISTATQTALNAKQDTLVSGTNIKTINGNSILGSGEVVIDSIHIHASNKTGSTIPALSVVYINGVQGSIATIGLAQANSATTSNVVGITNSSILNNSSATVISNGDLTNVNTSGFTEGDSLWLSPSVAGGITTTKPTAPDVAVFLGTVTRSHNTQGTILVRIQISNALNGLYDVSIASATTGQLLRKDSDGLWKGYTLPTTISGLGITDAQKIITQSATAPSSPSVGDLWIDLS